MFASREQPNAAVEFPEHQVDPLTVGRRVGIACRTSNAVSALRARTFGRATSSHGGAGESALIRGLTDKLSKHLQKQSMFTARARMRGEDVFQLAGQ